MTRALAAVALALLATAGCSSNGKAATPAKAQGGGGFANPVDYLLKAKCTPDAATKVGTMTLDGASMFADCVYPSNTNLRVSTFKSSADRDARAAEWVPQDGSAEIVGDNFIAVLTAAAGEPPEPAPGLVQAAIGGEVRS